MFTFDFLTQKEAAEESDALLPLLTRVARFMDGEKTADDLLLDAVGGRAMIGAMRRDGVIVLVISVALAQFTRVRVLHIDAIAGRHFDVFSQRFFPAIEMLARHHQCDSIQARARSSMSRLIKRYQKPGQSVREYSVLRLSLGDTHVDQ